jgi:hypothetical protein
MVREMGMKDWVLGGAMTDWLPVLGFVEIAGGCVE